ncbi:MULTISPECIES: hypothetical protein [Flavobacterium]|uniref:Uncharacterized protein n=1 Tax=Flavobacterium hankyongi TaxID=1176532 RepID=A0ABP8ZRC3_9FLAO|nr:hypothetical protein [Flavobacterium sp. N1846]
MSQSNFFVSLISSLEDPEFDEVAKLYLQEVDGIKNIINCNGPWDKGLDMRHVNVSQIENQYQITTIAEKKLEAKIIDDLKKAKRNVEEYKLPNKVKYFYSLPLSNTQVLKYKKLAKDTHDIILDVIEANSLAEITSYYPNIGDLLFKIADFDRYRGGDEFFNNSRVKSFYDLMSFGSSTDIKYNIVKAYILYYLSEKENVEVKDLLEIINKHFTSQFDSHYFESLLRRMSSERLIVHTDGELKLTDREKIRISKLLDDYGKEEALLKKELSKVLDKYKLLASLDEIIPKLTELYESNYSINLGEFTKRESSLQDLQSSTKAFNEFLKSKLNEPSESENVAKDLLSIADKSDLLSRIAAGQVYSEVSDPDRLQDYISQHNNNKTIFLDTNFLIVALCVFYESSTEYDNYHFKVAKQFLNFSKKNNLNLVALRSYAIETANLFKDALDIIPFTKLELFESLGGSSNILYRFYKHLKDYGELHSEKESFEDFLKEFKFEIKKGQPEYNYLEQMEWLLNSMEIEVETPEKYDLSRTREIITNDLKTHQKYKPNFAINNDAIMLCRLADSDVDVNPIDPIFCTWDMSLFRVRRNYFSEFPNCTKWLMYTPTRLMDHFSMMNFQVRKGTLFNEILSILDVDFGFQEKTQTLLDAMITIINPNDSVGLKYANKLAELKQKEIIQVDEQPDNIHDESIELTPVDIVFQELFRNYIHAGEGVFYSFKEIFTKQEYFDLTFNILSEEISSVKEKGIVNDSLFNKIDAIIKEIDTNRNEIVVK